MLSVFLQYLYIKRKLHIAKMQGYETVTLEYALYPRVCEWLESEGYEVYLYGFSYTRTKISINKE